MNIAQSAWDQVTPVTIMNGFQHTGLIKKLTTKNTKTIYAQDRGLQSDVLTCQDQLIALSKCKSLAESHPMSQILIQALVNPEIK